MRAIRIIIAGLFLCLALSVARAAEPPADPDARYLVGAYYYTWYPGNWTNGYLRAKLEPPQRPVLGQYHSASREVAEQHIAWCSRYGIDFLALDWWPRQKWFNATIDEGFLRARNLGDVKFCVFFETQDLLFRRCPGANVFFEYVAKQRFLVEAMAVAEKFFDHPSYLKLDGRPVMIFYLTRSFSGIYLEALELFRARCREKGWDPYLIGDEIFWQVADAGNARALGLEGEKGAGCPAVTDRPQARRMAAFDAVTAYNMYESGARAQAGYASASDYITEVDALWRRYRRAAGPEVGFVPNLIPGFNDRGTRLNSDHYAIPRQWAPGAAAGSFLAQGFRRLGWPHLDPDLNLILITSFNEWNEDTAIEPLAPAPPTNRDQSPGGRAYTQGYEYAGFGTAYLEVIRDQACALYGRAAPRALVGAWRGERLAARARADQAGWYTLSRRNLPPGPFRVGLLPDGPRRSADVLPGRAVEVNLAGQKP